ncbi:branched-chain amino acid ABC transporter permease [Paenibacillus thiaminolyticus]|uniref:Branched-chain amino acid ABC transporter permease n=1 Tax=Paenibacillus thiaminolyticus TaxID=49283 RepID=A0AAP9J2U7_PANTH|nr:branched-chain amino acid ABC transporter permease [Paenibacillus thiaminolyticus]MCY9536203.1 branched-chain amino acid ABC transporter permease [Paenibacillus thiaminolyticus]MCY9603532.1 branched-chain amino acid ABC transporter permease [Paenibacillus thiaminolyticus]MCY9605666.1 branched-chain amino acid ABC transporter permease [Paenibacillus thiaminolyticus]MCY9611833.1 branched-chain amino acid ABC transporter permease [Paenibacillus thiaminolyticus]MCY9620968.1 branched-chain amino
MNGIINLLVNGLATGMLIFLLASGLTLIFGLMGVLNFAHGGLFAWGAYGGVWVYAATGSFAAAVIGAVFMGMLIGLVMERLVIRPVYGNPIQQILVTLGAMLVLSELLKVAFGPNPLKAGVPPLLNGSWELGGIIFIKYRLFIIGVGAIVFAGLLFVLKRTTIGIIVRAGVMNPEMVQALGIPIRRVFTLVFMAGAGLAALGGALLAPYSGVIFAEMGMQFAILAFIVVVIGGMGSIPGSALAAVLVGLSGAFMAYYVPELSLAANMLLMVIVLLIKPSGLFGAKGGAG